MGCDIHMFIEYRQGNGMPWVADDHHAPHAEDYCKKCEHCIKGNYLDCPQVYVNYRQVDATCRNYSMFGLLANVRGDGPRDPLGLPEDVSEVIKDAAEKWGIDGHSHSFMSLEQFKKVVFDEAQCSPTDRADAFYDKDYSEEGYRRRPPYYTTIVNYCENLKKEKSLDKILLQDESVSSEVQVRLVFWFDN